MRKILPLLAAAIVATPALAHDRDAPPPPRDQLQDMARVLSDPRAQAGVAGLVDALADAVMQTHVGPLAALAPDADVRPGDTLGDIQRRRDPNYRARLRAETAGAVALAGAMTGNAARMSDELGATIARVQAIVEPYAR